MRKARRACAARGRVTSERVIAGCALRSPVITASTSKRVQCSMLRVTVSKCNAEGQKEEECARLSHATHLQPSPSAILRRTDCPAMPSRLQPSFRCSSCTCMRLAGATSFAYVLPTLLHPPSRNPHPLPPHIPPRPPHPSPSAAAAAAGRGAACVHKKRKKKFFAPHQT